MLRLPPDERGAFKDPFGPVYTDAAALLDDVEGPLVAVGDVVTAHLRRAGRVPDVAVVDGLTKRETIPDEVRESLPDGDRQIEVENEAGVLSAALLEALRDAVASDERTVVLVDGEEDLATVPAVLVAPVGASVVYGQPNEGMVHVRVTDETRAEMRACLSLFEGDLDAALATLGVDP